MMYDFIDVHEALPHEIKLFTNFPRRAFENLTMTLRQAELVPAATVFVEEIFETDDDEIS